MSGEQGVSWRGVLSGWRVRAGIALFLGVTLLAAMLLQHEHAYRQQEAYGYLVRTNQWIASQLQLELLRFLRTVDGFVVGNPPVDHDEVMLRFDLLWSRVPVFLNGPEAAAAREIEGAVDTVTRLLDDLRDLEPLVEGLTPGDFAARDAITAQLASYHEPLHKVSLEVAIGQRRTEMLGHLKALAQSDLLFGAAVLGGGMLLMVLLLGEIRRGRLQTVREREARMAATMANQAKSRFLANMSHELRTPLNAIIGFAELMQTECLGPLGAPRYREYLADIISSGRHLLSVLNDVLDTARVEAGTLRLAEQDFDPCAAVAAAVTMLGPAAAAKDIKLVEILETPALVLRGDGRLFRQICLNLAGNSLKFCQNGATVTILCDLVPEGLLLAVEDNGPGIATDELEQVTQPFYQCEGELDRQHDGCGLGLAITKAFAELHGGTLKIASQLGQGTRITIVFPQERVTLRDADPSTSPLPAGSRREGAQEVLPQALP